MIIKQMVAAIPPKKKRGGKKKRGPRKKKGPNVGDIIYTPANAPVFLDRGHKMRNASIQVSCVFYRYMLGYFIY